jgi:hypothetical protein
MMTAPPTIATTNAPPINAPTKKSMSIWPSLEAATRAFDVANVVFWLSLVVGVFATAIIIWMGAVKERHWEQDRQTAGVRIAELDTRGREADAKSRSKKSGFMSNKMAWSSVGA